MHKVNVFKRQNAAAKRADGRGASIGFGQVLPLRLGKHGGNIFGARAFIEGYIWKRLVLHAEYEWLSFPGGVEGRDNTNGVLVGAGYKQDITDHWSMYGLFLFPVYDELNVYSIMEIKVGVNYKF